MAGCRALVQVEKVNGTYSFVNGAYSFVNVTSSRMCKPEEQIFAGSIVLNIHKFFRPDQTPDVVYV